MLADSEQGRYVNAMNNVLIIIPAYNEAENIERVVDNLTGNYPQYDYVIINDGSSDNTRKICARRGYNMMDLRRQAPSIESKV